MLVALINRALEMHGALPTVGQLETFAKAIGERHPRRRRSYPDYLSALTERRTAQGLWTPSMFPQKHNQPDFTAVPDGVKVGNRRKKRWTRDECIESLILALDLVKGAELTERRYQMLAVGNPNIASYTSVTAHGSFATMRSEARDLRRQRLERRQAAP